MRNTLLVLGGLLVLHAGASRLYAVDDQLTPTEAALTTDLATLRDFTAIQVEGDFALEVVQGAEYSVEFAPPSPNAARFYATVRDGTLQLEGFGNVPGSRARVTLPELRELNVARVETLSVSGFEGPRLSLKAERVPRVMLRNSRVGQWQIRTEGGVEIEIDRTSFSAGKFDLDGRARLSILD